MSAAANTFLRLSSTVSQPSSPTSLKSERRISRAGSALGGTHTGTNGAGSGNGTNKGSPGGGGGGVMGAIGGRCGPLLRYLSSNPKMRKALAHIGLVLLLAFYTAAGAAVIFNSSRVIFSFTSSLCWGSLGSTLSDETPRMLAQPLLTNCYGRKTTLGSPPGQI